jgi:hypothetical protein
MDGEGGWRSSRKGWVALVVAAGAVLAGLLVALLVVASRRGITWRARYEARIAELRAAGEFLTLDEIFADRASMPADEDSAPKFAAATAAATSLVGDRIGLAHGWVPSGPDAGARNCDWALEAMRDWTGRNARAIELMHGAAQLESGCHSPPYLEDPFWFVNLLTGTPHVMALRMACGLLHEDAQLQANEGRADEAARDLFASLRLAASVTGRTPIAGESATASEAIFQTRLAAQRVLHLVELPADALVQLSAEAERLNAWKGRGTWILFERAAGHEPLTKLVLDPRFTQRVALSPRDIALYRRSPALRYREALFWQTWMDRYADLLSLPPAERASRTEEARQENVRRLDASYTSRYAVSRLLLPGMYGAGLVHETREADLGLIRAALAVEQWRLAHGAWPASLSELVPAFLDTVPLDPLSDGTIRYVVQDRGVVLYSLGVDGLDDGGLGERDVPAPRVGELRRCDRVFSLLDPEVRGARQFAFREEALARPIRLREFRMEGLTDDDLRELGLDEGDFYRLR